jgi:hypothetical protein
MNGQAGRCHVRFGSKADIPGFPPNVRFTPKSGHWNSFSKCPLCAKSGHMHRSNRATTIGGTDEFLPAVGVD